MDNKNRSTSEEQQEQEDTTLTDRRRFAQIMLAVAAIGYGGQFPIALWNYLVAPAVQRKPNPPLMLGTAREVFSEQHPFTLVRFGDKTVFLAVDSLSLPKEVRADNDGAAVSWVRALNVRCTHAGCTVEWQPKTKTFVCHCHGGEFRADGSVLRLPPTEPLEQLTVRVEGGNLVLYDEPVKAHERTTQ